MGTGTVVLVALAVLSAAGMVGVLIRAGRREAEAEKARLAEQARVQAVRSMETVWAMASREFEEYIAELCRWDGCTEVRGCRERPGCRRDGPATGRPEARGAVQALREAPHGR